MHHFTTPSQRSSVACLLLV
jgi:hypothetical protein